MNKVAFITGSSRGIGRAVARELAHQGYAVGINYIQSADMAAQLVEELTAEGCRAMAVQADVADRQAITDAIRTVELEGLVESQPPGMVVTARTVIEPESAKSTAFS